MLDIAQESGLKIPKYLITTSKYALLNFMNKYKKIITKPISEVTTFWKETPSTYERSIVLSSLIRIDDLKDIDDNVHFSLFQQYIEGGYCQRTF